MYVYARGVAVGKTDNLKLRRNQFAQMLILIADLQAKKHARSPVRTAIDITLAPSPSLTLTRLVCMSVGCSDGVEMDIVTALDRLINTYLRTNTHFTPTDM